MKKFLKNIRDSIKSYRHSLFQITLPDYMGGGGQHCYKFVYICAKTTRKKYRTKN